MNSALKENAKEPSSSTITAKALFNDGSNDGSKLLIQIEFVQNYVK